MALFRIRKLKKSTAKKEEYLKYYRAGGRLTWAQWLRKPKSTTRTKQVTGRLKKAGLSEKDIARLRGK